MSDAAISEETQTTIRWFGPWKRHKLLGRWVRPFAEAFDFDGCWQAEYEWAWCPTTPTPPFIWAPESDLEFVE